LLPDVLSALNDIACSETFTTENSLFAMRYLSAALLYRQPLCNTFPHHLKQAGFGLFIPLHHRKGRSQNNALSLTPDSTET
jgi:hypothetical protein